MSDEAFDIKNAPTPIGDPAKDAAQILDHREKEAAIGYRRYSIFGVFLIVVAWLFIILWMVYMQATGSSMTCSHVGVCDRCYPRPFFELSDSVLIALITTATANVLVFLYIILRYLFPTARKV